MRRYQRPIVGTRLEVAQVDRDTDVKRYMVAGANANLGEWQRWWTERELGGWEQGG